MKLQDERVWAELVFWVVLSALAGCGPAQAPVDPAEPTPCATGEVQIFGACEVACTPPSGPECDAGQSCVERAGSYVCASNPCPDGDVAVDSESGGFVCLSECTEQGECASGACLEFPGLGSSLCVEQGECPGGLDVCSGACLDLDDDEEHCGVCGNACAEGSQCVNGQCACADGTSVCGGACGFDLGADAENCGQCGNSCTDGGSCVDGLCMCPGGLTTCEGVCVDLNTDTQNCGGCRNRCPQDSTCVDGQCSCTDGSVICAFACGVDLMSDPQHCGECWNGSYFGCVDGVPQPILPALGVQIAPLYSCAIMEGGRVFCWGDKEMLEGGQFGFGDEGSLNKYEVEGVSRVERLSLGGAHGYLDCALLSGGVVSCWHWERNGYFEPEDMQGITRATDISSSGSHACAVHSDGVVSCWGENNEGQLGDGTTMDSDVPVSVLGVTGATGVVTGFAHSCAVTASGKVFCWGRNSSGELGNMSTVGSVTPVEVVGLNDAEALYSFRSGFGSSTCAVTSGGKVSCWGENSFGRLGDGTMTERLTPVELDGLTGVTHIAMGVTHACALTDAGKVWCWGRNIYGQIGDGSTVDEVREPVEVTTVTGVTDMVTRGWHTCALTSVGEVWCWGLNRSGQLGNGTTADSSAPVMAISAGGASSVSANSNHTCATTPEGEVLCWGLNEHGELGDRTVSNRLVPTEVDWTRMRF